MSNVTPLRPARPDDKGDEESKGYMPRLPWVWIVGLGAFIALSVGTMYVQDKRETTALRAAVLKTHRTKLGPIVARYEATVGKINSWAVTAAQQEQAPETFVDERLNLDQLHKGKGLYLRVPAEQARTPEELIEAARAMGPDSITRCLGITPVSARSLYTQGTFLASEWITQAEETDNLMKLRVIEDELRQRTQRDLPGVATALESEWFLMVLERGENRRDHAVDAYLYDLRTNKLLLRSRMASEGQLIAARIVVDGVKPGAYSKGDQTGAAQDCSIASQLREIAGRPAAAVSAAAPKPREAYDEALGQQAGERKPQGSPEAAEAGEAAPQPAPEEANKDL